jgi:hypothetical protein
MAKNKMIHATARGKRPIPQAVAAFLIIVFVCGGLWLGQKPRPLAEFDQPFYLGIAYDLRHAGRFTDGYFFAQPEADGLRPPSMRFVPLYPALLAGVAHIDSALQVNMDCLVNGNGRDAACGRAAPIMRGLQFVELCVVFWMVWWLGLEEGRKHFFFEKKKQKTFSSSATRQGNAYAKVAKVFWFFFSKKNSSSSLIAWLTLALALPTAPLLLRSVNYLMTEMTCLLLTTAATLCAVQVVQSPRPCRWAVIGGALLALAALTRPAFLYLLIAAALAGGAAVLRRRAHWPALAAFIAASVLLLAPWFLRNALVLGRPALTFGYASHTLVQRIAFDAMNGREYGMAYVCWLPDGTALGRAIAGPGACDRFGWDDPRSFYLIGQRHLLDQTLAAAGGYAHHMQYLLHTYIFAMPVWHILVSIPLALRGAYVAHWWGFILLAVCLWQTGLAVRRANWAFLAVALPAWFMLALNAAVAVNQVRYNLMLIPPYALAGAMALGQAWHWAHRKWMVNSANSMPAEPLTGA